MTEVIDTYWSFRSPYSYLAIPDLLRLRDDYGVDIALRVVLPIAVRDPEKVFDPNNLKPMKYIVMDAKRRAEYLGLPYRFPAKPDPVVQDLQTLTVPEEQPYIYRLCKMGVEAQRRGRGLELAAGVSRLIMGGTENWDQGDHLANAVASAGLDLAELDAAIADGDHMAEIEQNQQKLDSAGHWGVPTMVLRDEPFFGQDRIDTLRWRLDQYGLMK
ncbi:MAG: 2-hydroxychromene-2-carboxylate isomerase [Halioglobus sp.]